MNYNNENSPSHRRPPSRIVPPGGLADIKASDINARSSSMPPPTNPLKRKTINARGGELRSANPSSRSISGTARAIPIPSVSREVTQPSSNSSFRSSSNTHSRNASFSSTMGSGSRVPSTQVHRPQSAMSNIRLPQPLAAQTRPLSSFDVYSGGAHGSEKKKGRILFPSTPRAMSQETAQRGGNKGYDTQSNHDLDWPSKFHSARAFRDFSIGTAFNGLSLCSNNHTTPTVVAEAPFTPSQIPLRVPSVAVHVESPIPSPSKSSKKPKRAQFYLTRDSNLRTDWDTESQMEKMESMWSLMSQKMDVVTSESDKWKDSILIYKSRIAELNNIKDQLTKSNDILHTDLHTTKSDLKASTSALEDLKRYHSNQIDDLQRQHRRELEEAHRDAEDRIKHMVQEHGEVMSELKKRLENALEDEAHRHRADVQAVANERAIFQQRLESEVNEQRKATYALEDNLQGARTDLSRERLLNNDLKNKLSEAASQSICLETSMRSLRAQIEFLESDNKSQSHAFVDLETRLQNALRGTAEANEKLRNEETLRRKLHNQVQELKGNIRVFCRVRPSLESDPAQEVARITYPDTGADSTELEVLGQEEKSSLGNITTKKNAFAFDRVFTPESANADVFGEISQLVQSALDGYNVCIFCYGQTGSGKTYTMSADDGMIPRAVHQIYNTAKSLEEKGWKYSMEGSFIEVYNENLNDLLGKPDEFDKRKHEIRHDMQKCKTTITDITVVDLDTPDKVESILRRASANRSVAATKANERSSRSHSVFILKLAGENSITGEKSEGTLNLVDLAGSERLSHSKATGDRLKETQNINKSLSCLGDVIGALGQGKEGGHVPYRNSKLTYLLQFSLGGNSKTLMFVMISPLQSHLSETLTSLKFATKVHNTHIGTAKRQTKIRDL